MESRIEWIGLVPLLVPLFAVIVSAVGVLVTIHQLRQQKRQFEQQLRQQRQEQAEQQSQFKLEQGQQRVEFMAGLQQKYEEQTQQQSQFEHKLHLEWSEFHQKYDSLDVQMRDWLEDLAPPEMPVSDEDAPEGYEPYVCGAPITDKERFYGRKDQMNTLIQAAMRPQMSSVSILGTRRSGKTSLLNILRLKLTDDRYPSIVTVKLDLQTNLNSQEDFYSRLVSELIRALEARSQRLRNRLNIPKEVNFATVEALINQSVAQGWRLFLLLDELEKLTTKPNIFDKDFFDSLRSLVNLGPVGWVTTSFRPLIDLGSAVSDGKITSPFFNVFERTLYLGLLSPQEAHDLIIQPAQRAGKPFEEGEVYFIIELSGRMPFALQKASQLLYDQHRKNLAGQAAMDKAQQSFVTEMERHYQAHMRALKTTEKQALIKLASHKTLSKAETSVLQRLGEFGFVVEQPGQGFHISGRAFEEFLRR